MVSLIDRILPKNPVTGARNLHLMPESWEYAIGDAMYDTTINSQGGSTEKYHEAVNRVGMRLFKNCHRPEMPNPKFSVVASNIPNAWCLPGCKIAFNKGLIKKLEQEKETFGVGRFTLDEKIAAVASHEITHASARHSARSLEIGAFLLVALSVVRIALSIFIYQKSHETDPAKRRQSRNKLLAAQCLDFVFNPLTRLFSHLMISHGSRARENEADRYGMAVMKRAGYKPEAAVWLQKFFVKMAPQPKGLLGRVLNVVRTHPYSEERVERNRQTLRDLKAKVLV